MGKAAARITPEDFLIPPEFRSFDLADKPAGRVGGLRLCLRATPNGTQLASCYQQIPLRVLPPFRLAESRAALLYLLNPTAGLMDGDAHLIEIDAGPGSRTIVVGQSANRLHPALRAFSTQQWHIRVADGALLIMLPGPNIPFQAARSYQRVWVELERGAGFVWGDLCFSGRYARGLLSEQFLFKTLIQEFLVEREGRAVFRDRFCWQGPWDAETSRWHFGPFPACGSLFATGNFGVGQAERRQTEAPSRLRMADFLTAQGDVCQRFQGRSQEVTQAVVTSALKAGAGFANGTELLSFHELAPNHWFSVDAPV